MKKLCRALALLAALSVGCAHPPPTLSPVGARAFREAQVLKSADVLRDFAVNANATMPPILDTATTRKIVQWHESALKITKAATAGWQAIVIASLDEAVKDVPPQIAATIAPYVSLVKAAVKELP